MTDSELIDLVARLWVVNGGDADGVVYAWRGIARRVAQLISEREAVQEGSNEQHTDP